MKILTIKEALERVNSGGNLEGFALDETSLKQVNIRDAIVLSREGIIIPEQNIYYNDDEIEYDEELDKLTVTSDIIQLSWEEKAKRAEQYAQLKQEVLLNLATQKPEIDDWIVKNRQKIEHLLRPILIHLFDAEQVVRE